MTRKKCLTAYDTVRYQPQGRARVKDLMAVAQGPHKTGLYIFHKKIMISFRCFKSVA